MPPPEQPGPPPGAQPPPPPPGTVPVAQPAVAGQAYPGAPYQAVPAFAVAPTFYLDLYDSNANLAALLTPEQIEGYKVNGLRTFSPALAGIFHFITFGLFSVIFHGLKHGELPQVKNDDPTAGKAIGFSFIPFFSLYWTFVTWPRLAQRINFQYRLRGQPPPLSSGLVLATCICTVVPIVFSLLAAWIMSTVLAVQVQDAANRLARGEV